MTSTTTPRTCSASRDALELPRDEIDAEARERHLARALEAFDDAPARVVPMRRRRLVSIAAAAAVVLAVVAVGAVIATRGADEPTATRAADARDERDRPCDDDGDDPARDAGVRPQHTIGIPR